MTAQLITICPGPPALQDMLIKVTLAADNYTNGAAMNIDIASALPPNGKDWANAFVSIAGVGSGGQGVVPTIVPGTYGRFTVRLYNGTTELATAAQTFSFLARVIWPLLRA